MKYLQIAAAVVLPAVVCLSSVAQESNSMFDAPVVLKVGDKPLNGDSQIMYPSPAIFDVDNDGKDELIIGSIFGALHVCENESESSGEPVWSAPKALNSKNGQPLELNNW